jgi:hypothetical protein
MSFAQDLFEKLGEWFQVLWRFSKDAFRERGTVFRLTILVTLTAKVTE